MAQELGISREELGKLAERLTNALIAAA